MLSCISKQTMFSQQGTSKCITVLYKQYLRRKKKLSKKYKVVVVVVGRH